MTFAFFVFPLLGQPFASRRGAENAEWEVEILTRSAKLPRLNSSRGLEQVKLSKNRWHNWPGDILPHGMAQFQQLKMATVVDGSWKNRTRRVADFGDLRGEDIDGDQIRGTAQIDVKRLSKQG